MLPYWRFKLTIQAADSARLEAIQAAAQKHWAFGNLHVKDDEGTIGGEGEGSTNGINPYDFSDAIAREIWLVNGSACPITVEAFWIDPNIEWLDEKGQKKVSCPIACMNRDEGDYSRIMAPNFTNPVLELAID